MSGFKAQLDADIKTALLARDSFRVQTLRGLKAVILDEEVAKNARETGLDDEVIQNLIAREVKKRREAHSLYEKNDRQDLADNEKAEIDILSEYLPEPIGEDELQSIIDAKVEQLSAKGDIKKMGAVMGAVKKEVGTAADGALVAKLVRETIG